MELHLLLPSRGRDHNCNRLNGLASTLSGLAKLKILGIQAHPCSVPGHMSDTCEVHSLDMPEILSHPLPQLQKLELGPTIFASHFEKVSLCVPNLTSLSATFWRFQDLGVVSQLSKLKNLDISGLDLSDGVATDSVQGLSDALHGLACLETLCLESIAGLSSLNCIHAAPFRLSRLELHNLPDLSNPTVDMLPLLKLSQLVLVGELNGSLPDILHSARPQNLSCLTSLKIKQILHAELPAEISVLTQLQSLENVDTALEQLPVWLSALSRLTALVLDSNNGLLLDANLVASLPSLGKLSVGDCVPLRTRGAMETLTELMDCDVTDSICIDEMADWVEEYSQSSHSNASESDE